MTHAELNRARAIDIETAELSQEICFADPYGVLDLSLENFGTRFLLSGTF